MLKMTVQVDGCMSDTIHCVPTDLFVGYAATFPSGRPAPFCRFATFPLIGEFPFRVRLRETKLADYHLLITEALHAHSAFAFCIQLGGVSLIH